MAQILIIDDKPEWIDFTAADLGVTFDVELATTPEAALLKLTETHYDLIIANSHYSNILETIRQEYPHQRVVVATGQESIHEAVKVFRLGVLDYFAKDFRSDVMSRIVREALQKPVVIPA
jgi:DNA-binding NtrC family response regulator